MMSTNDSLASPSPLRILEVLEPSGGGSGRHFLDLCRGLNDRGHHVEAVYSPLRAEDGFVRELKSLGLAAVHTVRMTRSPGPSDLAAWRGLRGILKRGVRFDVAHGHSSKAGALTRLALPFGKTARIYTPHAFRTMDPTLGSKGHAIFRAIEGMLARTVTDHIICVSQDEYEHALAIGIPRRKLSVIINGVAAPAQDMAATVLASFGIPMEAFVFGFVGRLSHQKAPERLIEAFRTAASRLPDAYLVMVGAGEQEAEVKTAIEQSGLKNRIRLTSAFTGPKAVASFDVLVMPSRYEAMSYVMLEAAAAGKPIVSMDVGGASTVIDDGLNGIIVANDGDSAKLAAAMVKIAAQPVFSTMRDEAIARKHRYALDIMIDRTEALYKDLSARR